MLPFQLEVDDQYEMRVLERGQAANGLCKTYRLQCRVPVFPDNVGNPWNDLRVLQWSGSANDLNSMPKVFDALRQLQPRPEQQAHCGCSARVANGGQAATGGSQVVAICANQDSPDVAAFVWFASLMRHVEQGDHPVKCFIRCLLNVHLSIERPLRDVDMLSVSAAVVAQAMLLAVSWQ